MAVAIVIVLFDFARLNPTRVDILPFEDFS